MPAPPQCLKTVLGNKQRLISFTSPVPEGVEYVGRNHLLVEGLARYLLEDALENVSNPTAARCGVTITNAVDKPTTLLLLRLRHLLETPLCQGLLAEECLVVGFTGSPTNPLWLPEEVARELLQQAEPVGDFPIARKRLEIDEFLKRVGELDEELRSFADRRAHSLSQSHRRVRTITKEGQVRVKPLVR